MDITISVIKADVGSVGGHTRPSERMRAAVREELHGASSSGLLERFRIREQGPPLPGRRSCANAVAGG